MTSPQNPSDGGRVDRNGMLANDRTLLAWLRTGVSLTTFGFVIARLGVWLRQSSHGADPLPEAGWMGALFVILGAAMNVVGIWSFLVFDREFMGERPRGKHAVRMIAVAAAVTALDVGLGLFVLSRLTF